MHYIVYNSPLLDNFDQIFWKTFVCWYSFPQLFANHEILIMDCSLIYACR